MITGYTRKRLRSYLSESDEDISSKKQTCHSLSSDSDSESYDTSTRYSKEPVRHCKKKGMSHDKKRIQQKHKGIVWFSDM